MPDLSTINGLSPTFVNICLANAQIHPVTILFFSFGKMAFC
jgi:hypothetical protein